MLEQCALGRQRGPTSPARSFGDLVGGQPASGGFTDRQSARASGVGQNPSTSGFG